VVNASEWVRGEVIVTKGYRLEQDEETKIRQGTIEWVVVEIDMGEISESGDVRREYPSEWTWWEHDGCNSLSSWVAWDSFPFAVVSVIRPSHGSWFQCFQKVGHVIFFIVFCINSSSDGDY
jgi:hypothetical protein